MNGPRRSTRERQPSKQLLSTSEPSSLPMSINDEPPEQWPPRPEDLPPGLIYHAPLNSEELAPPCKVRPRSEETPTCKYEPNEFDAADPSIPYASRMERQERLWDLRRYTIEHTLQRGLDFGGNGPTSAVRESLMKEDEIRSNWVVNKPEREAKEIAADEERDRKCKMEIMVNIALKIEEIDGDEEGGGGLGKKKSVKGKKGKGNGKGRRNGRRG
ncbi:hypothetical protein E8E13_010236 [Curvularia kusanoi]|uniref:Uncharacterized protein n=1 Tax=Curvularia kusanoi TaxID=90978 RepID=A0A9P4TKC1_CURKU|nr:hypothetical protein E8E13_010236 [Curvularia kusanoi]